MSWSMGNKKVFIRNKINVKKVLPGTITVLFVVLLCVFTAALCAMDDDVKKMLRKVTGITDADIKSAEGKKELTFFDAYALSVRKTERLAIEGENSIQAEERKLQAIETFFPSLSLRGNLAFPRPDSRNITLKQSGAGIYARQPIITGLKEASKIQSSRADRRIKEYQLYDNAGRLLADVGLAYYSVLLAQRELANSKQLLELYSQTMNELQRRFNIGRSRRSDILRTNAQIYSLQARIKSISTSLEHSKLVLATLIGTDTNFNLIESATLDRPPLGLADTQKLVEARWDVKAAREQVEYARAGVLDAYGLHLPSLYIEGAYLPSKWQEDKFTVPKWKKLGSLSSSSPASSFFSAPARPREWYVQIGAELPIFGGDITFAKVREANSKQRQSDLAFSQALRHARQEIIDSFQVWESSRVELEAYQKAFISAEENYRVVMGEYRLNLVTILDVLTSLASLQTTRDDFERAKLQSKLNRIKLGVAINEFSGDKVGALKRPDSGRGDKK